MSREAVGHFELLVLLAVIGQRDEAYGVPIAHALEDATGRAVSLASVYNALERLEEKGLLRSMLGVPTAERGGRAKRYFSVTPQGMGAIREAKRTLTSLWRGIPVHEG
jgi:DNA-binding PadR family transcriptional regulator